MFPFQWPGKQSQEIIIHHPYIIDLPLFNFFCGFCVIMMDANVSLITYLFIFLWMILTVTSIGYSWFLRSSDLIMLIQKFTINAWLWINAIVLLRLITWIKKKQLIMNYAYVTECTLQYIFTPKVARKKHLVKILH